jgi:hypothetical protein
MALKKLLILAILFLIAAPGSLSQQPQTSTAPIYAVNAKYVQGTAPGYWSTAGSGLTLNLAAGTVNCANTMRTYAGGTLAMTNSTTNYVYLDAAANCAPASNTSGFSSTTIPLATVITSGGAITAITDDRTFGFAVAAVSGPGTVTSVATTSPITGGTITASGTIACATCVTSAASLANDQIMAGAGSQGGKVSNLSGDVTTSGSMATTVAKVNAVSYGSGPSTHQVPVVTATNTATYKTLPDCTDTGGNHINYTQSSDLFSCGTSGATSGTVTTTGSPASGNLAKFSGSSSITNGDLSGDVTTTGTLAATVVKVNGASVPASATLLASNSSSQLAAASLTNTDIYVGNGSNLPVGVAVSGDATLANTGALTIANNAVTAGKSAVVMQRRTCAVIVGADNASAVIANGDLGVQGRLCFVPFAATVVEVTVSADAGTPNVIPRKNSAGSTSNLVSSALATGSSGAIACSNTGGTTGLDGATTCSSTLQNTSLAAGDYIELGSGTAGGVAKRMSIFVTYTVN